MPDVIDFVVQAPVPSLLIVIAAFFTLLGAGTKIPWLASSLEGHPQGWKVLLISGAVAFVAGVGLFAVPQVTQMLTATANAELDAKLSALQQGNAQLRDEAQSYKTQGEKLRQELELSEETSRNYSVQLQENAQVIAALKDLTANQSSQLSSLKQNAKSAETKIANSEIYVNELRNAIVQKDDSITRANDLLDVAKAENKVLEENAAALEMELALYKSRVNLRAKLSAEATEIEVTENAADLVAWYYSLNPTEYYSYSQVARSIYYAASNDLEYLSGAKSYSRENKNKVDKIIDGYYSSGYLVGKQTRFQGITLIIDFKLSNKGKAFFDLLLTEAREIDRYAPVLKRLRELN